jgi:hypothetical protein
VFGGRHYDDLLTAVGALRYGEHFDVDAFCTDKELCAVVRKEMSGEECSVLRVSKGLTRHLAFQQEGQVLWRSEGGDSGCIV